METDKSIIIGSDHAAYELKEKIKVFLIEKGYAVVDAGTTGNASVSYVDYGKKVAGAVSQGQYV
ncbi:MAG: RpiB/LacA/LacB family sugar-phosphate isomerase, partial [Proteobacteria bacterium]|nr:RpiB/LacA/LacB family sugar-phosphate isomerase [Pseudomonadota bacterium]